MTANLCGGLGAAEEHAYVVGKLYTVPCVFCYGQWWPLLGPAHTDESLGIYIENWHLDARFISDRLALRAGDGEVAAAYGCSPIQARMGVGQNTWFDNKPAEIVLRRRRCVRETPVFPSLKMTALQARDFASMEMSYRDAVLCKVCPHRGIPTEAMPIVDGVRVCPGHGLRWDAMSRRQVRHYAAVPA